MTLTRWKPLASQDQKGWISSAVWKHSGPALGGAARRVFQASVGVVSCAHKGARENAKISPSPCWPADSSDPSLCAGRFPSAGMLRPFAGRTVTTNKVWQGVGWGALQVRRIWPKLVSWCNRGRGWKTVDQRFSPSWKCGGDEFYLSWGLAVIVSPERKGGENLRVAFTERITDD